MANIPKRLILSALIAFTMTLVSQERIFADLTTPPEESPPAESSSAESQAQDSDTEALQIEPSPIPFQVGIDTTNFDTVTIGFGGVSISGLGLAIPDNVGNKTWLSLPPGFSRTHLPERPLDRPPSQPLSRPYQTLPSGVRLPGQDPSPDSHGLAQSETEPIVVPAQQVLEVLL